MPYQPAVHDTFTIERHYAASPERVFAALAEPAQKRLWYAAAGPGHEVESFEMDFRVGGREVARYRFTPQSPFPGVQFENESTFLDILPGSRVVMSATMTFAGQRISAALISFEVSPAAAGTTLLFTHQAAFFENADGPARRLDGWQKLLDRLAQSL